MNGRMTTGACIASLMLVGALAGCVAPGTDEPIRILRSDAESVVLRGLIDATRTTPPPRYDALAASQCAASGRMAEYQGMQQHSTFGFDVTYACVASN